MQNWFLTDSKQQENDLPFKKEDKGKMKKIALLLMITGLVLSLVSTASADYLSLDEAIALVEDFPTVQAYTDEPVDSEDLQRILTAGINAPSGMNSQPWHFSVVTDHDVLEMIASEGDKSDAVRAGIPDAPLAIVISCTDGASFDAGLVTQAMSIEAQLLGYGTKLFISVRPTLNGEREQEFREILQIPDNMSAIAVMIIGKENHDLAPDAISTPTSRYPAEYIVSYITPQ